MTLDEFRDLIEDSPDRELFQEVQKCVCKSLAQAEDPASESHNMLDLAYAECTRRGKERLYDKAYETVCRKPHVCKVLLA